MNMLNRITVISVDLTNHKHRALSRLSLEIGFEVSGQIGQAE